MSVENRWEAGVSFTYYNSDSTKWVEGVDWSLTDLSDFAAWLEDMLSTTIEDVA